ncbi:MAG: DUF2330 domain-containing protein [Deltaproteobacteria bacterium]|nr:DUF2330 domain-containing protein [Deltaproteobacteria bacterium]
MDRMARGFVFALALLVPANARAFCGFYVAGADDTLVNDATMVVMMREGSRTVLSMQNHYQGPPEGFAMVVPVPEVLQEGDVKVLQNEVFERIDHLAAPRLVEYWERDPCWFQPQYRSSNRYAIEGGGNAEMARMAGILGTLQVNVEAEFVVGEYEIVILGAEDSGDLETWLRLNDHSIPDGAEPVLRPYVEAGMKFFVAKVDPTKVAFEDGHAKLSPLRFHYDTDTFQLPVRLGLLNAEGEQDLIVHIIAPEQRYELANYPNVTIPTNIDVADEVRDRFAEFYAALFDETLVANPRSVVTEYSWQATNCDPCPGPPFTLADAEMLGADVLPSLQGLSGPMNGRAFDEAMTSFRNLVLTRLHTRYDRETLTEDLVFREAAPIVGGREVMAVNGELEHGSQRASVNNFQGRYAIRHPWEGPIECEDPVRGRWGGSPGQSTEPRPATELAFAARGQLQLPQMVRSPIPELGVDASATEPPAPPESSTDEARTIERRPVDGCGGCAAAGGPLSGVAFLAAWVLVRRRR